MKEAIKQIEMILGSNRRNIEIHNVLWKIWDPRSVIFKGFPILKKTNEQLSNINPDEAVDDPKKLEGATSPETEATKTNPKSCSHSSVIKTKEAEIIRGLRQSMGQSAFKLYDSLRRDYMTGKLVLTSSL